MPSPVIPGSHAPSYRRASRVTRTATSQSVSLAVTATVFATGESGGRPA
jgi:hypothetical protein